MDAQAAARLGDEIAHGFGLAAMVAGAVAGAVIGALVVGATVATGGAALAIVAGSIAAGGLSMFQIAKGLTTIFNLPEPPSGVLAMGSRNVYINGRNAMRAGEDFAAPCSGFPFNHPPLPGPVLIAQGSGSVFINGKPAARLNSKMVCGAHIKSGSPNTFIGGPTMGVAFIWDLEGWMHTGLEILGMAALAGAAVLAAAAGLAALGGFVAVTGLVMGGMAGLGALGDCLGPGYGDLFQGIAGMAMLGLPLMTKAPVEELPVSKYKPGWKESDITSMAKGSRPPTTDYLTQAYHDQHLEPFKTKGGSFLFTPDDIADPNRLTFNPRKFVMNEDDMQGLISRYQDTGDVSVLEDGLGYSPGSLQGKDIYLMHLDNPDVGLPTGNEGGVNSLWKPGGLTDPGGMREAVLNNVPIVHNNDVNFLIANQNVVQIQ